ncbi:MAG TPA: sigma-70 family RNA polymerase sigma factor [Fibrobacteria bacterium]|nr:sigma-70 family RNA polymerase sigma factor [Fibrobacteria bacterium]
MTTERKEIGGRKDWQAELYRRYHAKVMGICQYFLKDREEAKDAAQDVFIKVFRAWGNFKGECEPMTWIGVIAKHDCFSRIQRHRRRLDRRENLAQEEELRGIPEGEDGLLLYRIRLEKCLPLVRGKLREILHLNLELGLNHREIAVRMGVSRVAITRRLTRFKKTLQDMDADSEAGRGRALIFPKAGIRAAAALPTENDVVVAAPLLHDARRLG